MSEERMSIHVGSGAAEYDSGYSYDRARASERLSEMVAGDIVEIPDPGENIRISIKLAYDPHRRVFVEQLSVVTAKYRKAREFPFDQIVDAYIKHKAAARFMHIVPRTAREARAPLSAIEAEGEHKTPDGKHWQAGEYGQQRHERGADQHSEDVRSVINRVQRLYPGERVRVWSEEDRKLLYLEKGLFGNGDTFVIVAPMSDKYDLRVAMVHEFRTFTPDQVEQMAAANPAVVTFEESLAIRELAHEKAEARKKLGRLSAGEGIIIGERLYTKDTSGVFLVIQLGEQTRSAGTREIGKSRITIAELEDRLEKASPYDQLRFIQTGERERGLISETDSELAAVHERFAHVLSALYPGVVKKDFFERVGLKDGDTERNKVLAHYRTAGDIKQGRIGFCFALGAAFALKRTHPELYFDMVARSIRRVGDTWQVRFLGYERLPEAQKAQFNESYPGGWIPVSDDEISRWKSGVNVGGEIKDASKADEVDIILERAYLSYRSYFEAGENVGQTFVANAKGDLAAEGGFGNRALFDMLGPLAEKWKISPYNSETAYRSLVENGDAAQARSFFEGEYVRNPQEFVVTVNSPADRSGSAGAEKAIEYKDPNTGRTVKLPKKHAYGVLGVRQAEQREMEVCVVDPHNTKEKQYWIPLTEFTKLFSSVSYVKLVSDFRRDDPAAVRILKERYG